MIGLPGGQINDLLSGKDYSLPFLQQLPSLGLRPLTSTRTLLPELQRYKDTVRCGALGAGRSQLRQEQLTKTLIVRLLKTHFFTPIPDFEKPTE